MTVQWFSEIENDSLQYGFAYTEHLASSKSPFQTLDVVRSTAYGKMLFLDGRVMLSEADEFVYHEVIAHVPMVVHPNPKKVIIIGGGDGGTIRELVKYPELEEIVLCEIDQAVIDVCKEHFPDLTSGLTDPRVKVTVGDGVAYIQQCKNAFDIAIIDSTDPIGPGEGLFTADFYKSVKAALRPGGVVVAQSESPWHDGAILRKIYKNMNAAFAHVSPYVGSIPTYPRGLWSWSLCTSMPRESMPLHLERIAPFAKGLRYLSPAMIEKLFVLPKFYADKLQG